MDELRQKPTYELVQEAYDWVQDFWQPQFEYDDEIWNLVEDDYNTVELPDTDNKLRLRRVTPERMTTQEGARVVNRLTSLYSAPSSIGLLYTGPGAKAVEVADKAERGINEAMDSLNPPSDSPFLADRWNTVAFGRCARLMIYGNQYYDSFPEYREGKESLDEWNKRYDEWEMMGPIPIVWKSLPPESTFPTSFGRLNEEHISWLTLPAFELSTMFSEAELAPYVEQFRGDGAAMRQMVILGIYANLNWLTYALLPATERGPRTFPPSVSGGGCILRNVEHKMGRTPIRILPGITAGRKQPGLYWRSVLHDVRGMIKAADKRLSEAATGTKFSNLPLMKAWMQQQIDQDGEQQDDLQWLEGDVIPLRPGQEDGMEKEDIQPVYQPDGTDNTLALVTWALGRTERMTGAVEALEGSFGPAGQPAWSRQHSVDQALAQLAPLTNAMVGQDLDAAESIIAGLVVHGTKVSIKPKQGNEGPNIVLDPDQLADYKPILKAEYKAKSAQNIRADYDLAVSLQERVIRGNLAGPSPDTLLEKFANVEQPLEEFKRTMTWQFLLSEEIQTFYRTQLVKQASADVTADESMDIADVIRLAQEGAIDPRIAMKLVQQAQMMMAPQGPGGPMNGATAGNNGNNPVGPTPETVGAIAAENPMGQEAGGPQPTATEAGEETTYGGENA